MVSAAVIRLKSRGPAGSFGARLTEIGMFFQGNDAVHQTMRRVTAVRRAGIPYAIVGGMAVNAHRHSRTTKDVDLLLTATGFATQTTRFDGEFAAVTGRPRRFIDPPWG